MEIPHKAEDIVKNTQKTRKNSRNPFANFLKWSNKINKISDYESYFKENMSLPLVEWTLQVIIIRPILIAICLLLFKFYINLPQSKVIYIAEGISLLWFLIIELKQDIWRK